VRHAGILEALHPSKRVKAGPGTKAKGKNKSIYLQYMQSSSSISEKHEVLFCCIPSPQADSTCDVHRITRPSSGQIWNFVQRTVCRRYGQLACLKLRCSQLRACHFKLKWKCLPLFLSAIFPHTRGNFWFKLKIFAYPVLPGFRVIPRIQGTAG
jgi:hypothetical protein